MSRITLLLILALLTAGSALAQDDERAVGRFSNPSLPRVVVVEAPGAAISVEAHSGSEVIADARLIDKEKPNSTGLRQIRTTGLRIEESDNVMRIHLGKADTELRLQVPVETSLRLKGHYAGPIEVRGVRGDHEISNFSRDVILTDVSGSAIISTWSGDIKIMFLEADAGKPMSFVTQSGDIDVTFPSGWNAGVQMSSQHGEIYMDLNLRRKGGDSEGAGVRFKSFSGDIYVRRAK